MFKYKLNEDIELRLLEQRHADEIFQLTDKSRNHLREWLPWVDATKTVNDTKEFINATLQQFSNNNGVHSGIWYKGELAGVIGLHGINWTNNSTSIGYWLGDGYQGKGIMTTACKGMVDYCFQELKIHRIEIRAASENYRSQAIPERLGFQKEGCLKSVEFLNNKYVDHYVYGLINEAMSERKGDV